MKIAVLYSVTPCSLADMTNVAIQWYISSRLLGVTAHKTAVF
jgi:hypothetical protein